MRNRDFEELGIHLVSPRGLHRPHQQSETFQESEEFNILIGYHFVFWIMVEIIKRTVTL